MGLKLAQQHPAPADIVVPVPDSGNSCALGYAQESKIPFNLGLIRNHYIGRTFIEPAQHIRDFGVRIKLNPIREILKGRRIALIDDSIVRGTTSRKIVRVCREAGAREVHLRISSPPTTGPCVYGMDTPRREELIAAEHDVESIRGFVGADSLGYLGMEGLLRATGRRFDAVCTACWSGEQPVKLPRGESAQLGLFDKSVR